MMDSAQIIVGSTKPLQFAEKKFTRKNSRSRMADLEHLITKSLSQNESQHSLANLEKVVILHDAHKKGRLS